MKIYVLLKNADFTEGRGPMLLHSVWSDGDEAIAYVKTLDGIMGTEQYVERDTYSAWARLNGYQIIEKDLLDRAEDLEEIQKRKARETALAKLTREERKLLGLA